MRVKRIKVLNSSKVIYSDVLAKSCRFCCMILPKNLEKEFYCIKCLKIFGSIGKYRGDSLECKFK